MSTKSSPHRIRFKVWDRLHKRLVEVERSGRLYDVSGVYIKLFPIGVLAEAIDRTTRTVTDWERKGWFPKPMYNVPDSSYTRWYSEAQILFLNELWLKYRERGKGAHFDRVAFLKEVHASFYKVDVERIREKEKGHGQAAE